MPTNYSKRGLTYAVKDNKKAISDDRVERLLRKKRQKKDKKHTITYLTQATPNG